MAIGRHSNADRSSSPTTNTTDAVPEGQGVRTLRRIAGIDEFHRHRTVRLGHPHLR